MKIATYKEFWAFYLQEHSHPLNRRLHFIGTTTGFILLIVAAYQRNIWLLPLALLCGYAFAWTGHFFVERNRPATFKYPLWSFFSDWRMWFLMVTRRPLK
ncbi:MAG: Mpo1-like protein [Bdellovibrionales bacterium]